MPSASPIYTKHRLSPPPPVIVDIYSDPSRGLTTVDGAAYRQVTNTTWADLRNGAGNIREYSNTRYFVLVQADLLSQKWLQLQRHKATFSLAAIPPGSTITAVRYYFWPVTKGSSFATTPTFGLYVPQTPPWNDVILSDYENTGSVLISTVLDYNAIVTGAFNYHDILPAYLSLFQPGQLAKIAHRVVNWDANNAPPTWKARASGSIQVRTVDYTDPAQHPFIRVTYVPP
jgi:hypothetical protein